MQLKVGGQASPAEPWQVAGAPQMLTTVTIDNSSITVGTSVGGEQSLRGLDLEPGVGQLLPVWPETCHLPSLSWFPCLQKGEILSRHQVCWEMRDCEHRQALTVPKRQLLQLSKPTEVRL